VQGIEPARSDISKSDLCAKKVRHDVRAGIVTAEPLPEFRRSSME
jgi:hypothetical protein